MLSIGAGIECTNACTCVRWGISAQCVSLVAPSFPVLCLLLQTHTLVRTCMHTLVLLLSLAIKPHFHTGFYFTINLHQQHIFVCLSLSCNISCVKRNVFKIWSKYLVQISFSLSLLCVHSNSNLVTLFPPSTYHRFTWYMCISLPSSNLPLRFIHFLSFSLSLCFIRFFYLSISLPLFLPLSLCWDRNWTVSYLNLYFLKSMPKKFLFLLVTQQSFL